jgi:NAD(P)-dependent dehydrogenase (short-subunit alcohol dehydrogenase family)
MDELEGLVGIVTGAGNGIGRAIAIGLATRGMRLALVDHDRDGLATTRELTDDPAAHRSFIIDVGDAGAVERTVAEVASTIGSPNVLINCAGFIGRHALRVWELQPEDWATVLDANFYGSVNFTRAVVPLMSGISGTTHIVTVASIVGLMADGRMGAYVAAKHALVSFTETLQLEVAAAGLPIGVTLVCPGGVATNLNAEIRRELGAAATVSSSGDWLQPEEVAERVIAAVGSDDFYVFTHPHTRDRLLRYQQKVLAAFDQDRVPQGATHLP